MPETFSNSSNKPVPFGQVFVANGNSRQAVQNVPPEVAKMQQALRESPLELPPGVNPAQLEIKPEQDVKLADLPPEQQVEIADGLKQFQDAFAAATTAATAPAAPPETTAPVYTVCPRCSWDTKNKLVPEATEDEKERFVVSVLGQKPFTSVMTLMGGRLLLTFRTITSAEEQRIERDLLDDTRAGKLTSTAEWIARSAEWRLSLALQRIDQRDGNPIYIADPKTTDTATPAELYTTITAKYLQHESLLHAAAKQYRLFRNKVELLEENMSSDSFW